MASCSVAPEDGQLLLASPNDRFAFLPEICRHMNMAVFWHLKTQWHTHRHNLIIIFLIFIKVITSIFLPEICRLLAFPFSLFMTPCHQSFMLSQREPKPWHLCYYRWYLATVPAAESYSSFAAFGGKHTALETTGNKFSTSGKMCSCILTCGAIARLQPVLSLSALCSQWLRRLVHTCKHTEMRGTQSWQYEYTNTIPW